MGVPRNFQYRVGMALGVMCVLVVVGSLLGSAAGTKAQQVPNTEKMPPWKAGYLDIHHIRAGSSETTLMLLPDGKNLLIDAGDTDYNAMYAKHKGTLEFLAPKSGSASDEIVAYLRQHVDHIDYCFCTHYHSDHIGAATHPKRDGYEVTGISRVAKEFGIGVLYDRAYPKYDEPVPLRGTYRDMDNYLDFIEAENGRRVKRVERAEFGMKIPCDAPDFGMIMLKRGLQVLGKPIYTVDDLLLRDGKEGGKWDENKMSLALVFEYGCFRYFEGGDNEHNKFGLPGVDTTTPTVRAAGPVDVATLNHHSHGVNAAFATELMPKVVIQQDWCSDQPTEEALAVLTTPTLPVVDGSKLRELFSTAILPSAYKTSGLNMLRYASLDGHVVVRVSPPPKNASQEQQTYAVFVLDDDHNVVSKHGPYRAVAKCRADSS